MMKSISLIYIICLLFFVDISVSNPYCRLCPKVPHKDNHLCWMFLRLWDKGTTNATYIPFTDETRHAATMLLNSKRSIFSQDYNVSNMNIVNWDRELEHLAHLMIMQPIEGLISKKAYSDITFEKALRYKCCRTLYYQLDFILYVKNFEFGSGNQPDEHDRVLRSSSAYDVFRLFMDTWSVSENPFQMFVYQALDKRHIESRYRVIYWGELDVIGCAIVNSTKYQWEPLTEKHGVLPRIIMHCYFGSELHYAPRAWNRRVFERGPPCTQCPKYKQCNAEFKGLCGSMRQPGYATMLWNEEFWDGREEPDKKKAISFGNKNGATIRTNISETISFLFISIIVLYYLL